MSKYVCIATDGPSAAENGGYTPVNVSDGEEGEEMIEERYAVAIETEGDTGMTEIEFEGTEQECLLYILSEVYSPKGVYPNFVGDSITHGVTERTMRLPDGGCACVNRPAKAVVHVERA